MQAPIQGHTVEVVLVGRLGESAGFVIGFVACWQPKRIASKHLYY
jgi:hypothetical protein